MAKLASRALDAVDRYGASRSPQDRRSALAELDGVRRTLAPAARAEVFGDAATVFIQVGHGSVEDLELGIELLREAVGDADSVGAASWRELANLGAALRLRYELTGDPGGLEEAMDALATARRLFPSGKTGMARLLAMLGELHLTCFDATGNRRELAHAVEVLTEAVRQAPGDGEFLMALCRARAARFEDTGDARELDEVIALAERAARAAPSPAVLDALARFLRRRSALRGSSADLDASITALRRAIEASEPAHWGLAPLHQSLGADLMARYGRTLAQSDLDEAIAAFAFALEHAVPGTSDVPTASVSLGRALDVRYHREYRPSDLEAAIAALGRAAEASPPGSPEQVYALGDLGSSHHERYTLTGRAADLGFALDALDRAIELSGPADPNRGGMHYTRGLVLRDQYERTGSESNLAAAIHAHDEALHGLGPADGDYPLFASGLGGALQLRYERDGDHADLDRAIELHTAAVDAARSDDPQRPGLLFNLGLARLARYDALADDRDLAAALEHLGESVRQPVTAAAERSVFRGGLASARFARYQRSGRPEDLSEAIESAEQAFAEAPPRSPERLARAHNLAVMLRARHAASGNRSDRDRAISLLEEVVRDSPPAARALPGSLSQLADALQHRWATEGSPGDAEAAADMTERRLEVQPRLAEDPVRLTDLGLAAMLRYRVSGSLADIERARSAYQQAVDRTPDTSPQLPLRLTELGRAQLELYLRTGALDTLDAAIVGLSRAASATALADVDRAVILDRLGAALTRRHERTGSREDLDAAITHHQRALSLTSESADVFPALSSNLGVELHSRYRLSGAVADLDAAIDHHQRAVRLSSPGGPDVPQRRANLATCLADRARRSPSVGDFEAAVAQLRAALDREPARSPSRSQLLFNLAVLLMNEAEQLDHPRPDEAIEALREACELGQHRNPRATLMAARLWVLDAVGRRDWPDAVTAGGHGTQAVEQLYRAQVGRDEKQLGLSDAAGLSAALAYALARLGRTTQAVVTLERSRAQVLSEALETERADLERLAAEGHGDLRDRYARAASVLHTLELRGTTADEARPDVKVRRAARDELDAVIAEIQKVDGHGSFLRPAEFAEIARVASSAPLVYVLAGPPGGLALIVEEAGPPRPVWLHQLTTDELERRLPPYVRAYLAGHARMALDELGPWLWREIMCPLLDETRHAELILVPVGWLGLLPLHAAWTEDAGAASGRRYALDRATISYAPNARVLAACQGPTETEGPTRLLVVADGVRLRHADSEAAAIAARFASPRRMGTEATVESLFTALPGHGVLHFACHGRAYVGRSARQRAAAALRRDAHRAARAHATLARRPTRRALGLRDRRRGRQAAGRGRWPSSRVPRGRRGRGGRLALARPRPQHAHVDVRLLRPLARQGAARPGGVAGCAAVDARLDERGQALPLP